MPRMNLYTVEICLHWNTSDDSFTSSRYDLADSHSHVFKFHRNDLAFSSHSTTKGRHFKLNSNIGVTSMSGWLRKILQMAADCFKDLFSLNTSAIFEGVPYPPIFQACGWRGRCYSRLKYRTGAWRKQPNLSLRNMRSCHSSCQKSKFVVTCFQSIHLPRFQPHRRLDVCHGDQVWSR